MVTVILIDLTIKKCNGFYFQYINAQDRTVMFFIMVMRANIKSHRGSLIKVAFNFFWNILLSTSDSHKALIIGRSLFFGTVCFIYYSFQGYNYMY